MNAGTWRGATSHTSRDGLSPNSPTAGESPTVSRRFAPTPPQIAISATATARPPPETSWQLSTRPRSTASRMKAWSARSRARSRAGGPSSGAAPASRAYSLPPRPAPGSPTSSTALPSARNAGPVRLATSSSSPTTPISGVGAIADAGDSLYSETLPPVTGSPSAMQASDRPRTASLSCQNASGRVGSPKLRQLVTPSGRAPVIATLRVASATDIAAPSHGSSTPTGALASVEATSALVVPLIRSTAAPRPGPATVFAWTLWSYCSYTERRDERFGEPSSAWSTAPGSWPRSGRASTGSAGAPGAGARRRRVGGRDSRWNTIAPDARAAAGIRASSRAPSTGRPAPSSAPEPSGAVSTTISGSGVTRPMTATGRSHRVHTSRTASQRAGSTIATIRSCDSEIITSNGSSPGSRRGIASRSISIPVPARSADSDVAQVIPAAPRSWTATTRPPAMSSSVASISSFSANGSPTWTLGRLDGSWSPNVAEASTDAPPIPSRPVAEPYSTTRLPTPSAAARVSIPSSSSPIAITLTSGLPWYDGSNTSSPPTVGTPTQLP